MDLLTPIKRFDAFQQRHNSLAIPLAVVKKFGDDGAGNLAALVAYFAFFSIFPLLLVFVTVLGFVLHGHPTEITNIENSVYSNFPSLKSVISFNALKGSVVALVIGIATSLWSGLGVTNAAQNALDSVWAVPKKDRPNFIKSRLRGLGLLVSLGVLFIVATLVSGIATGGSSSFLAKAVGIILSFLVNNILFLVAFRFMTASEISIRNLRSGVILAALFWTILQAVGGAYIGHVTNGLKANYAQFAITLALLVWLHLGAQLTMYAAELNTVLERRLYPRSLMGPPDSPADQATLTAIAMAEERNDIEHVAVSFSDPEETAGGSADTALAAPEDAPEPEPEPVSPPVSPPGPDPAPIPDEAVDGRVPLPAPGTASSRPDIPHTSPSAASE